jgi:hypothetical protein
MLPWSQGIQTRGEKHLHDSPLPGVARKHHQESNQILAVQGSCLLIYVVLISAEEFTNRDFWKRQTLQQSCFHEKTCLYLPSLS